MERHDGPPMFVAWNVEAWHDAPDKKKPLRLEVDVPVLTSKGNGMPQASELADLAKIQEKLVPNVERKVNARYVMRFTGAGRQRHVFYTPQAIGLLRKKDVVEHLAPTLGVFSHGWERTFTSQAADDPEWTALKDVFPSTDPDQWFWDREAVRVLAESGADLYKRHMVTHWTYFPDAERARSYLKQARRFGFKALGGPKERPDKEPLAWCVRVKRREREVTLVHLHPGVLKLVNIAKELGGDYDGWEAEG